MSRVPRNALTVAIAVLALAGCTSSSPPAVDFCVPRITVEPTVVSPGEDITMSSDTTCDAVPPAGGWTVIVAPVGQPGLSVSTTVTQVFDGSFSVILEVPDYFPLGEAYAGIDDWDYSPCDDTSVNGAGSCASASGSFMVAGSTSP